MGGKYRGTAIQQYMALMESLDPDESPRPYLEIFYAIMDQIITRIARVDLKSINALATLDPSLNLLFSILDSKLSLLRSGDLIDIFSVVIRLPMSHAPVKRILRSVFERRLATIEGSYLQLEIISMFKEFMDRGDLTVDYRSSALRSLYDVLQDMSPSLSELNEDGHIMLTRIDNPTIALILSFYLPPEYIFPALLNPSIGNEGDELSRELLQERMWFNTSSTLSHSQYSFLRAIILGASQVTCSSAIKLLESQSFRMTNETVSL
ncbi:hypothetical protein CPB86DRAFT_802582 [Serendipita vermifera]|nr:hypothetical protein CPB86DRAFT_802582 [Serendipita vermifera]